MEQNIEQNQNQNIEPKSKKYLIILIIIGVAVILIGLGIWYWQIQKSKIVVPSTAIPITQTAPLTVKEDSVSAVNQELDSIDVGNLDKEFQTIDTDLNSL